MNNVFIIPAPRPGDTRERNAFGVLVGFGEAYAAHYRKMDALDAARQTSDKNAAGEGNKIKDCRLPRQ